MGFLMIYDMRVHSNLIFSKQINVVSTEQDMHRSSKIWYSYLALSHKESFHSSFNTARICIGVLRFDILVYFGDFIWIIYLLPS